MDTAGTVLICRGFGAFNLNGIGCPFHSPPENVWDKDSDPNWVDGAFSIWTRDVLKLIRTSKEFLMLGIVKRGEDSEADLNRPVEYDTDADTADWYR